MRPKRPIPTPIPAFAPVERPLEWSPEEDEPVDWEPLAPEVVEEPEPELVEADAVRQSVLP